MAVVAIDAIIAVGDPLHVQHHIDLANGVNEHETRLTSVESFVAGSNRADAIVTTSSLAPNARYSGVAAMSSSWHLLKLAISGPGRVRLFDTTAHRTADISREIGVDPNPAIDHGVMLDYYFVEAGARTLSPQVIGTTMGDDDVPILIDNLGVSSAILTVTLTFRKLE